MQRRFLVVTLLCAALVAVTHCRAGLFVGVAMVAKGTVVLEPAEMGQGPGRVVERVRVELGDIVRIGEDGDCTLLVYDGTVYHFEPRGDYRIVREGIQKLLDGGEILIAPFRTVLGGRNQDERFSSEIHPLGTVTPRGRVFMRRAAADVWVPLAAPAAFAAGDILRSDEGADVMVAYETGVRLRLGPGTLAYLLADAVNVERGGGLVTVDGRSDTTFAASMTALQPNGAATFVFHEAREGCRLKVLAGSVRLMLKAQGLPCAATVRQGFQTRLTRAGTIDPLAVLADQQRSAELARMAAGALAPGGALTAELAAMLGIAATDMPPEAPTARAAAPPPPPQPPPAPRPDARRPATASDLEDLFQLPRLNSDDRFRARPD